MGSTKKYDKEYKEQAVKLAHDLGSPKEAAEQLGIPRDTLYGWIKKWRDGYLDIGLEARSPENVQHLNEEVEQLRQRVKEQERTIRRLQEERGILADATAFFASSRRKLGSGKD